MKKHSQKASRRQWTDLYGNLGKDYYSFSDQERERIRYRWEFLRRSPEYKEGYSRVSGPNPDLPFDEMISEVERSGRNLGHVMSDIELTASHIRALYRPKNSHSAFISMWEPSSQSNKENKCVDLFELALKVDYSSLSPLTQTFISTSVGGSSSVIIQIELDNVRSIDSLKTEVMAIIDRAWKLSQSERSKNETVKKKDYDLILRIGDMHFKDGMKPEDIANIEYPNDASRESATRKVRNHIKTYDHLVHGGHRTLSYP